jgi:hypothetical protein
VPLHRFLIMWPNMSQPHNNDLFGWKFGLGKVVLARDLSEIVIIAHK